METETRKKLTECTDEIFKLLDEFYDDLMNLEYIDQGACAYNEDDIWEMFKTFSASIKRQACQIDTIARHDDNGLTYENTMSRIMYMLNEFPGKYIILDNVKTFTMTQQFYRIGFNNGVLIKIKRSRVKEFQCV